MALQGGGVFNYHHIPSVTRAYTTACLITTAAVQMELISPFQIYFNPDLIFKRLQIWRLVTNFLYFGQLGFGFLYNMIFTYRYCRMLEETSFRGRTADFVFMFLFGGLVITVSFYSNYIELWILGRQFLLNLWKLKNDSTLCLD
ncbi:hypothetical protein GDO81_002197 [Engystomops pustulosus]|uniref:Derlin n=1 Tax=Engystomops pustulosus TaxID=76066 RepID=A0AAV7DLU6_ENGPU|nr:hypothetical protein GDO81_002197 [Engystomops pustulosus]